MKAAHLTVLLLVVLLWEVEGAYLNGKRVVSRRKFVPIIRHVENRDSQGSYNFESESEDGSRSETGGLKRIPGHDEPIVTKVGRFSYISPEGVPVELSYTSDELGFRPIGSHLPKAPEVPKELPSFPLFSKPSFSSSVNDNSYSSYQSQSSYESAYPNTNVNLPSYSPSQSYPTSSSYSPSQSYNEESSSHSTDTLYEEQYGDFVMVPSPSSSASIPDAYPYPSTTASTPIPSSTTPIPQETPVDHTPSLEFHPTSRPPLPPQVVLVSTIPPQSLPASSSPSPSVSPPTSRPTVASLPKPTRPNRPTFIEGPQFIVPILVGPPPVEFGKHFVNTPEFSIDSDKSNTRIRIGNKILLNRRRF